MSIETRLSLLAGMVCIVATLALSALWLLVLIADKVGAL